ncbi:DinB family protein [Flavivirga rizhaonensis]|uniref:DinB family protein n=1 Tax=Flavivirga rizhaonensis TaxID=2559571 RepID=A0A4S1DWE6_9FLAO|nr:DinB family protein [Flavivirga rizhaonensis]TGV02456.1 DinB family protein [Flavivirga rizhaonensis]
MKKSDLKFIPNFFDRYIALIDDNINLIDGLKTNETIFENVSEKLIQYQDYRYEPNKWTPKEMLQHIIDTERIFTYRALCISRLEPKALLGFDENAYADNSNANHRSIENLLKEFRLVRQSSTILFESFSENMLHKTGICFETKMNTLAIGFVIIGHAQHHINILKERYYTPSV